MWSYYLWPKNGAYKIKEVYVDWKMKILVTPRETTITRFKKESLNMIQENN